MCPQHVRLSYLCSVLHCTMPCDSYRRKLHKLNELQNVFLKSSLYLHDSSLQSAQDERVLLIWGSRQTEISAGAIVCKLPAAMAEPLCPVPSFLLWLRGLAHALHSRLAKLSVRFLDYQTSSSPFAILHFDFADSLLGAWPTWFGKALMSQTWESFTDNVLVDLSSCVSLLCCGDC